jgi:hypothetical protein
MEQKTETEFPSKDELVASILHPIATEQQVHNGLLGLLIIREPEEACRTIDQLDRFDVRYESYMLVHAAATFQHLDFISYLVKHHSLDPTVVVSILELSMLHTECKSDSQ